MATDYTKREAYEAKVHELFGKYLNEENNWSSTGALIGGVFRAMWSAALTAKQIGRIGGAMNNFKEGHDVEDLKAKLSAMVKAKVLRSYVQNGERHYEVNY